MEAGTGLGLFHRGKKCFLMFLQYGWKAIFKVTLLILKSNEDALICMPFEVMLSQINQMPTKFLIQETESNIADHIKQFDREMNQMRVPTILLERLKREFDDSNNQLGDQIKKTQNDSPKKKSKQKKEDLGVSIANAFRFQ